MRIVNITTNATYAKYPQRVVIHLDWDQPVVSYQIENLIFECEQQPGITITGYTPASDDPAPEVVYLGQTLVRQQDIKMLSPTRMEISFQVSPFMLGTLRVSNQSWNKPLVLTVRNGAGVAGDWSPFLAPGVFSNILCQAYYSATQSTDTNSINWSKTLYGTPKLKFDWACNGTSGSSNTWTGVNIKISDTNDFTVKPIVQWEGGNFWWWSTAGAQCSKDPLSPYPWDGYYSTNDTRTCRGPMEYLFPGYGGMEVTTTQLPTYQTNLGFNVLRNGYGSLVAANYTQNAGTNLVSSYLPCFIFGNYTGNKYTSRNASVGRMEGWILANPQNGDPLKKMPATWTHQLASSTNNFCLAPWRLAKNTDPVPMLIQVYYQLNWIYSTNVPG